MQNISERLGEMMKGARTQHGITQAELAEAIGKSERTVVKIEKGEGNPKLDTLSQIVDVLKLSPSALFKPDDRLERPQLDALCREIGDYSEEEASALIPVVRSFTSALRNASKKSIQQ